MAATAHTLEKLQDYVGNDDLDIPDIKFILKHWEYAPRKLHVNVARSVATLERIAPSVQLDYLNASPKAARAIGELLCPEAQDLILSEYQEDIPVLLRNVARFRHVSEGLWRYLTREAKDGALKPALLKQLVLLPDCTPAFAKAAGYTKDSFDKTRLKSRVLRPRSEEAPVKTVKTRHVDEDGGDEDFVNVKRVKHAARTVGR